MAGQREPVRTCVGCRRQRPKHELQRIVATKPEGQVRHDPEARLPGRGAYVCPDPQCIDAAARRDGAALRRALRSPSPPPSTHVLAALEQLRTTVRAPTSDGSEPPPSASKERQ